MSLLQKWLTGLIGLGALYLVATNPQGIASGIGAFQKFIEGSEAEATGRTPPAAAS